MRTFRSKPSVRPTADPAAALTAPTIALTIALTVGVLALALAAARLEPAPAHALWLLAGAPWAEELVFRAGLQAALRQRLGALAAIGLASLLFAAAHVATAGPGGAALGAATLLPSLLLGWLYERSGRVAPCVALHAAFNALWMVTT